MNLSQYRLTSMRKTLVGWEPGGLASPSLPHFFFFSLSRSSSSRRFLQSISSCLFSESIMFSFQRLPKTDSDASKENKETEVRDVRCQNAKRNLQKGGVVMHFYNKELKGGSSSKTRDAFFPALKRLLGNKLFMANFGSTIFFVFAFMGFGTFMPKYNSSF